MKFSKYILPFALLTLAASCKKGAFLDKKVEVLTEEKVFADSTLALQLLTDNYAYTGQDVFPERFSVINSTTGNDAGSLEDITTMAVSGFGQPQADFISGSSNAATHPFGNYWGVFYKRIRTLNLFIQNINKIPLTANGKVKYKAEARFLRAFYYASLVRIYGGVQLMGDAVLQAGDVIVSKRNTYKECVDYIVSECDAITADTQIPNLLDQPADQYGRVTKGMALALKARVLLTAASPLFNGQPIAGSSAVQSLITYSATYDAALWQKAADAFNAVIQSNQYSLVEDNTTQAGWGFRQQFLTRRNTENIFPFMQPANNLMEQTHFPRSRGTGGNSGVIYTQPTENAVQLFGMANGKAISDGTSGYNAAMPYTGRDPRFYYTVIFNQALIWRTGFATPQPVNSYAGSEDAIGAAGNFKTGYFSRKMCNDLVQTSTNKDRVYPIIRYAEIILGYAEALTEIGQTENAVTQLNIIRKRAGIVAGVNNRYGIAAGITKDDLRKIIQNEYSVELYQEGFYYYNCRRWKTAEVTENAPIQQMVVTRSGTAPNYVYSYAPTTFLSTFFNSRMYLAPIPQSEIDKSAQLVQNPGW